MCVLPGGQKSRLNLARAVYAKADIYIMDDILSSLDAPVARKVFDECLTKLLEGSTRLLVTHQVQLLHHPAIDRIVVLSGDGTIRQEGTYSELIASNDRKVLEALLGSKTARREEGEDQEGDDPGEGKCSEMQEDKGDVNYIEAEEDEGDGGEEGVKDDNEEGAREGDPIISAPNAQGQVAFVEEERKKKGHIEVALLLEYLKRYGPCGLYYPMLTLVFFICEQAVNVIQWFWLTHLTSQDDTSVQGTQVFLLMALGGSLCCIGKE